MCYRYACNANNFIILPPLITFAHECHLFRTQACHSAYDVVDEEAVYNCTGNPHPADIEDIVDSMMNEEFQTSFNRESAKHLDVLTPLADPYTA
jgi:hypothetical protein